MAFSQKVSNSVIDCPVAESIEEEWNREYPLGQNVTAQIYCGTYFINFKNEYFDIKPAGDVVLFKNLLIGFEVHARYKRIELANRDSLVLIHAIATKVKSQKIQYSIEDNSFLVDGKKPNFTNNWMFLSESETSIVKVDERRFHIYTGLGSRLTVYNCASYTLNITLTVPREHARTADNSLFGQLDGEYGQMIPATGIFFTAKVVADPSRDPMLEKQTMLKAYYDSFPDIDSITNVTNPDIKKAEEFTKSILNKKPSGNVAHRDTACHVLDKLLSGNSGQQCLFFDSSNGINLHDASGNLADITCDNNILVLKLKNSNGLVDEKSISTSEDDIKLAEDLTNVIEQQKNHPILEDIRNRLAKVHGVDKNSIIVKSVYSGSFNIVYTVLNLATNLVNDLQRTSQKLKNQFKQFLSAKIHPLLYRPSFDIAFFDSRGNKTFSSQNETFQVGPPGRTKTYTTAANWTRYGLKVLGKSEYKNDAWLHPFQDPGNWYRAFHGTKNAKPEYCSGSHQLLDTTAAPVDALASIYQTGFQNAKVAAYGPGVYCSPDPVWLETQYVGTIDLDTELGKKRFKCMFQVAVNPDGVKSPTDQIWLVSKPEDIRPYGILIKEA